MQYSEKIFHMNNKGLTDFIPIQLGTAKCLPGHTWGPYVRKYYLIHYVLKGKGIFKNQNGEYSVSAGQAFLIRPDEITIYTADHVDPWEYIWIIFDGELSSKFDSFDDVFEIEEYIFLDLLNINKYENSAEEYIAGILFRIYSELNNNVYNNPKDYVNQVIFYINTNYMQDIKIADIAKLLKISHKYLSRIFKEKTEMTVQEYLIYRRLHESKALLKRGFNVSESSQMVGYKDYFSFSKAFKKRYGISPSEYKAKSSVYNADKHKLYNRITSK